MKFSPIMIFVFILVVLALSIIFGDVLKDLVSPTSSSSKRLEEGFLSYNYDAQSTFKDNIKIEYYSPTKPVHRLYDNLYYDPTNGSVIVLFGGQYEAPKTDATARPEYKKQYYKMTPLELKWYDINNPDLKINGVTTPEGLQAHWETNGYKEPENQGRDNQPPLTKLELEWYRKNNPELSKKTDDELYDDWIKRGKAAKLSRVAPLTKLELKWYRKNFPVPLEETYKVLPDDAALQKHWWQFGYDEKRSKEPPSYVKDIAGYTVFNRDGTSPGTYIPTIEVETFEHAQSKVTDLNSSYTNIYIVAENNNDKYELVYIPWGKETYLHVIQLKSNGKYLPKHLRTYAYDATGKIVLANGTNSTTGINYDSTAEVIHQQYFPNKNTKDNNTYRTIDTYSTKHYLFQVCTNLYYNYSNGELVSQPSDNEIRVYSRPTSQTVGGLLASANHVITPGSSITVSTDVAEVSGFSAGVTEVPGNAYTILYISTGRRTILASLEATNPTNDNNEFKIRNVVLFDSYKKRDAGPNVSISPSNFGNTPPGVNRGDDDISLYYQFLLGMMGTSDKNISRLPITNDYMLKTQIVPPVCPTCPSCSVTHSGVCTNCGGQGGSGTQTKTSDKKEDDKKKEDEDDDVADLLKSTGSGATSLVRDAGSGATSLARDAASGTVGLAKDAASGTVGLAKETVGGAVGLAKDTVGGAVGLAKEAGSGIANTFGKLNPTAVSSPGSEGTTQGGQPTQGQSAGSGPGVNISTGADHSSYFGALPPKGGDFIPVTADFSRFGR